VFVSGRKKESFGRRISSLREERGLSLEDLSRETGYPVEALKEVEEGAVAPPVSLVLQLGKTFKVDIEGLATGRENDAEAKKRRVRSHRKRVASYAYTPLTKPGEEKHLRAYRVTIDPKTEHRGVEYHHEGEEFVYVLEGRLTIQVGQNTSVLKKGQSIHFNSSLRHKLGNPGREKAELLVVIYLP
jgi:quercetin dioxygenase-like cupin family protein